MEIYLPQNINYPQMKIHCPEQIKNYSFKLMTRNWLCFKVRNHIRSNRIAENEVNYGRLTTDQNNITIIRIIIILIFR